MNSIVPLPSKLIPPTGFLNPSSFPKINTTKYNLRHSLGEIEGIPNLLNHNDSLRRKYTNQGKHF